MLMIGLTGGLGAGKSSVSRTFAELGAVVIDADEIARDALAPGTPGLEAVEEIFGAEVIAPDGSLDRPALAKIVFNDPASRKLLNAITHPLVYQESTRLQRAAPRDAIVVHDIPLIIENGVAPRYHLVLVVHASERTRVRRVVKGRGLDEADALARIRSQADDDARRAAADVWLKNEGTEAELRAAVGNLWHDRLVPFNDNMLAGRVAPGGGEVRPPDRDWPAQAARLAARIRFVAGGIVQAIRHTGPTSRGEAAVDVLDLEVDVRDQGEAEHLRPILVAAGFPAEPGPVLRHGSADPGRPARVLILPRGAGVGGGTYRWVMRPITDLQRKVAPFEVVSEFSPSGDQPKAITELASRIRAGEKDVVLLGATGTGKSATTAWLIEKLQRPTLVMAPNKTLAAQLANEFRELLPNNAIEYFVSYYDYYQPEAYVPQTDTFIEKDSSINDEVERLRHSATNSLLTRRDVVVVASVSCIYGLGTPQEYVDRMVQLRVGDRIERDDLLRKFVAMQYVRNDMAFTRGTFRVRGDTVEIIPVYEELALRIEFFGDEIEAIQTLHPLTGDLVRSEDEMYVFPATHYVAGPERMERAVAGIEAELAQRLEELERQGKLLEAQRLRMRTTYDIEMMRQIGSCSGIENYSRHIDGRAAGTAPNTLIDYFPEDFLLVIDESHVTVPQIGAMYEGDMSRKRTLVEHGFRLPSAMDNRPLRWEEFLDRIGQTVFLSATPGAYELSQSDGVVEQIIRPTGLVDPAVVVKPTKGQIDDLLAEIRDREDKGERVLVTTLTKKMAEDLTDYLLERGIRVRYLHSEVDTLRRVELLRELRMGVFDVLVGINLLREGLDLPEVSLVSILDADKEGFLRSGRSLIQTIGRAARNVSGQVHMYADKITPSMAQAIDETSRRRDRQIAYNTANGIDPTPLRKRIGDITDLLAREDADTAELLAGSGRRMSRGKAPVPGGLVAGAREGSSREMLSGAAATDLAGLIQDLTAQMHTAAGELQFELAARLRDEVSDLKKELRQLTAATS